MGGWIVPSVLVSGWIVLPVLMSGWVLSVNSGG